MPRVETAAVAIKPLEVLPPPSAGPVPSTLAIPGESTMPLRNTAAAAALASMIAAAQAPAADTPKQPVIEKITDYAKADDMKALKEEIEALRKQLQTLSVSKMKSRA